MSQDNYKILVASIQQLDSGHMSDDWEQIHYNFFIKIRDEFSDFNNVYIPNTNDTTKRCCSESERLAKYLEKYIDDTGKLDYVAYRIFLEHIKYITDYSFVDNDISNLDFEKLRM